MYNQLANVAVGLLVDNFALDSTFEVFIKFDFSLAVRKYTKHLSNNDGGNGANSRVFARNQNLGSSTSMQEPLHKQAWGLKSFPSPSIPFLAVSIFVIMRYRVL